MNAPVAWFRNGGRWHVAESTRRSMCGVEPVNPPKLVEPTPSTEIPPEPCMSCLRILWADEYEADTLEDCMERGFEVSGPLD